MRQILFSEFTNASGARVAQVSMGGAPLCREMPRAEAVVILRGVVSSMGCPVLVERWDGDTGTLSLMES